MFASCNKDTINPPGAILGKWQLEKRVLTNTDATGETQISTAFSRDLEACLQDDFTLYKANGFFYYNKGNSLCRGETNAVDSFQYAFLNSSKIIWGRSLQVNIWDTLNIKSIDNDLLVFKKCWLVNSAGISQTLESYYRKTP